MPGAQWQCCCDDLPPVGCPPCVQIDLAGLDAEACTACYGVGAGGTSTKVTSLNVDGSYIVPFQAFNTFNGLCQYRVTAPRDDAISLLFYNNSQVCGGTPFVTEFDQVDIQVFVRSSTGRIAAVRVWHSTTFFGYTFASGFVSSDLGGMGDVLANTLCPTCGTVDTTLCATSGGTATVTVPDECGCPSSVDVTLVGVDTHCTDCIPNTSTTVAKVNDLTVDGVYSVPASGGGPGSCFYSLYDTDIGRTTIDFDVWNGAACSGAPTNSYAGTGIDIRLSIDKVTRQVTSLLVVTALVIGPAGVLIAYSSSSTPFALGTPKANERTCGFSASESGTAQVDLP